uniref:Chondrolectin n=1 Tax=Callorhinchus milii TaxID=7868 RepID=A0A4W3HC50_CALMI
MQGLLLSQLLLVLLLLLLLLLSLAYLRAGQTVCTSGSEHPCYKIAYFQELSRRVGFKEASQACRMDGGSLTSVESLEEQSLIEGLLQDLAKSASGISDGDFWIGLSRGGEERGHASLTSCPDLYRWTDGSAAKFRNWYTDEPSCGSEACVVMYHQLSAHPGLGGPYLYQWNDDRCNMKHNFICKYGPHTAANWGFASGGCPQTLAGPGISPSNECHRKEQRQQRAFTQRAHHSLTQGSVPERLTVVENDTEPRWGERGGRGDPRETRVRFPGQGDKFPYPTHSHTPLCLPSGK